MFLSIKDRNYFIYVLDLLGCGELLSNLGSYLIEFYVEVVREFINKVLLGKKVIFMGYLMGVVVLLMCFDIVNVKELVLVVLFNYYVEFNVDYE